MKDLRVGQASTAPVDEFETLKAVLTSAVVGFKEFCAAVRKFEDEAAARIEAEASAVGTYAKDTRVFGSDAKFAFDACHDGTTKAATIRGLDTI